MKKVRSWGAIAAVLGCSLLCWVLVRAQGPSIVPPFATTPFVQGVTSSGANAGYLLYLRHLNGVYDQATASSSSPYSWVTGALTIANMLSEGVGNLLAAPAGPPNVGRAAQMGAGGKFTSDGALGIAYLTFNATTTVNVVIASPSVTYTGKTSYAVGPEVMGVVSGDFNGDTVMDIAVTYEGDQTTQGGIAVLLNNGSGTFSPKVTYTAGTKPTGLATLDLNHDNILDLVVTDNASSSAYVLLGNGNGTFQAAVPYSIAGIIGRTVTLGDFDGDGNPDIAAGNGASGSGNISILLNNGNGTFRAGSTFEFADGPSYIAAGDFNGDTKLDLAVVSQIGQLVTMYLNTGGGNFQKGVSYVTSYNPEALIVTDVNHDGILDVIVGQGDARGFGGNPDTGNIDILQGRGDGTFQGLAVSSTGGNFGSLTLTVPGDFNNDGKPDVIVNNYYASANNNLLLFPGNGSGGFAVTPTPISLNGVSNPNSAAAGDFNGDGKLDLAVAAGNGSNPGKIAILLNNGSGLGAPTTFDSGGSGLNGLATGDFDGDGKLDLAVTNQNSGTTVLFHGNGNGTFQLVQSYPTGTAPRKIIAVDLDGDGRLDLAVSDHGVEYTNPPTLGAVYILKNNGSGGFVATASVPVGRFPEDITAGDVNGDGKMDLVVGTSGTNFAYLIGILNGNGDATLQAPNLIATDFGPEGLGVRDFNGDGKADIAVAHCCGATDLTYFQGNGDGSFQPEVHFNGPSSPMTLAVVDLNKDGAPDLLVGGNDGRVAGMLNNSINFPCSYQLDKTSLSPFQQGGAFTINIDAGPACNWSVAGLPDWITVTGASSGTGPGTVTLQVAATSAPRKATLSIAGINVNVNQTLAPVCDYTLSSAGQSFPASASTGSVGVSVNPGCAWTAASNSGFVTVTSGASGSGNGTVALSIASNGAGARSGTLTIAGQTFTVEQVAGSISGLNIVGSMAHLAAQENWTTLFTLVNKSGSSAQARLSLFGDLADPSGNGPLTLPVAFPQQSLPAGPFLAASLDRTLAANASLIVNTSGAQAPPVLVGSAQLAATGAVDGFAIFHQIVTTQEAVVPMETRNANSYLLAFDNTSGLVLGVAVENVSSQSAVIPVIIRDDAGNVISSPGASISLGGSGHKAFVLSDSIQGFPVTANKRGTIEFDTPSGGRISVLGLRFTPPNNALTTIPALANVGTGGGSIAHLASGGDGWQTTFVLVNTGTGSAQTTLSFFSDQTGSPLSLPLTFPQGNIADTTAPSVTRSLPAGATLVIVSSGASDLLTGSAQLATNGHVSGFVIFRHNGQEAVVPLESRDASAYIVAFDNTSGTATGVALNAVSGQQVNVPVTVRDASGATIATDTLTLSANGHYAFTLGSDRYPAAANIRGTIELDKPAGAQIGALGIRIPSGAAHTYTTLPALAK